MNDVDHAYVTLVTEVKNDAAQSFPKKGFKHF